MRFNDYTKFTGLDIRKNKEEIEDKELYKANLTSSEVREYGFGYFIRKDDGTICIDEYNGDRKELIVPDTIDGIKVSELSYICLNDKNLESLIILGDLRGLYCSCFYGCKNLKSICISGNLDYVSGGSLKGCDLLKEVQINSNCEIGYNAFPIGCEIKRS